MKANSQPANCYVVMNIITWLKCCCGFKYWWQISFKTCIWTNWWL